jgi:hypothetical protein
MAITHKAIVRMWLNEGFIFGMSIDLGLEDWQIEDILRDALRKAMKGAPNGK